MQVRRLTRRVGNEIVGVPLLGEAQSRRPGGQEAASTALVLCLALIVAVVFIATNVWSIPRINPDPQIGGDASQYISLTRGNFDSVPSPFRFRVLVPFLAALLPFSPGHSLMAITYSSLACLFVVLVWTSYKLNGDVTASMLGALMIFSSRWFLYNFQNPYLTDSFSLAAVGFALYALVIRSSPLFLASVVAGTLARETVLLFSCTWMANGRWRSTAIISACALLAYVIPRIVITKDVSPIEYFSTAITKYGLIADPSNFLAQSAFSWGYVFLFALAGFAFFADAQKSKLLAASLILLITALASCLVAVDFGRMFEVLGPVFALSSAQFIHALRKVSARAPMIMLMLLVMVVIQCVTLVPNAILPEQPPRLFRWAMEGAGLAITGFTYISIRTSSQFRLWSAEKAASVPSAP